MARSTEGLRARTGSTERQGRIAGLGAQQGWARRGPHLFLGLLGFVHSLYLHLLLLDSFLFLGDEAVNVHTTLEIQVRGGGWYSGWMRRFRAPHTRTKQGAPASPSLSASHCRAQRWRSTWWPRNGRLSHPGPPWPGDEVELGWLSFRSLPAVSSSLCFPLLGSYPTSAPACGQYPSRSLDRKPSCILLSPRYESPVLSDFLSFTKFCGLVHSHLPQPLTPSQSHPGLSGAFGPVPHRPPPSHMQLGCSLVSPPAPRHLYSLFYPLSCSSTSKVQPR